MIQCFVFDGESDTLAAMRRSHADWIAVISQHATWAQRDWYPRLLGMLRPGVSMIVPTVNEPGPDWQVAGPPIDDMLVQRKLAMDAPTNAPVDVTREREAMAPAAAVIPRSLALFVLEQGMPDAQRRAASRGSILLARSVYVVHHYAC